MENALAAQNQIIPVGTQKIGRFEYNVRLTNSPDAFEELNNLPIKAADGSFTVIPTDAAGKLPAVLPGGALKAAPEPFLLSYKGGITKDDKGVESDKGVVKFRKVEIKPL